MAAPANTGVFVTFEGGDGAGKSTQIRFLARLLEDAGREVVRLREPGGTAVGEALRAVVLDPAHEAMSDRAELLIYEAARAQIVDEVIRPALGRGGGLAQARDQRVRLAPSLILAPINKRQQDYARRQP